MLLDHAVQIKWISDRGYCYSGFIFINGPQFAGLFDFQGPQRYITFCLFLEKA